MKRILSVFLLLITLCLSAHSQAYGDLPPNPIGIVNYNTPGTFVNYSYSFTAPTTGVDYFGIAIRQDPGYWGIGNFSLTKSGNTTNLLQNPNLQYGGTTNTQYGLQAPADWGIWYQSGNGAPPAAGMYYAPGQGWMGTYTGGLGVNTSTAGSWIDGAVGTFDGIYQGIRVTAGTTYNFSFSLNGTQSSTNPSIEIGAYAGACASGSSIFTCTPAASSGFTAAATPQQTQGTGGAPPPAPPAPAGPLFTDLKFSRNQIADTQWNVGSCTNAGGTNCQIYSKSPGSTWNLGGSTFPGATQYIAFLASGDANYPWHMYLYNGDGSFASDLGIGRILSEGLGSDGHHYFFFSNANYNGTLFSTDWGMDNTAGLTINGTNSPTVQQTNDFASSGSTSPLAAGATGGGGSSAPTVTGTSTTDSVSTSSSVGATTITTNNYSFNNQTYIVTGTSTPTTVTTTTTPVTTTTYSDGSTTTSNGTATSTQSTTYNYTVTRPTNPPVSPYVGTNTNGVYIQQSSGYTDKVSAYQSGRGNYESVSLTGNNNNISVGQGYTFNSIGIANESVTPSNYNVLGLTASGSNNNITTSQLGLSNSAIINVTGNTNTATINQNGNNNQTYNIINGTGNALSVSQTGNGHLSAINLYGNNNVASVTQTGSNNSSVLNLTNAGGPNNVSVIQTGTNDNYSFQQICTNPTGCGATVIRH